MIATVVTIKLYRVPPPRHFPATRSTVVAWKQALKTDHSVFLFLSCTMSKVYTTCNVVDAPVVVLSGIVVAQVRFQ